MASVTAIGVPGQPAINLTGWQAGVRDALNSSDVTVDARIATALAGTSSTWTPASGWSGMATMGPLVTRIGSIVVVQGLVTRSTSLVMTTAAVTVGTLPVGFRPSQALSYIGHGDLAAGPGGLATCEIGIALLGDITVGLFTGATFPASGGYFAINAVFRAA